jgi:hypothetical protein
MSAVTTALLTGSQAIANFDLSKIFIFNNRFTTEKIINSLYDPMTLLAGTVIGRIQGDANGVDGRGAVYPCVADLTNGTQYPIGILAADCIIDAGDTLDVPVCNSGDIAQGKIIMWDAPTEKLTTVVSGISIFDRLQGLGIKIMPTNENTYPDNQ